MSDPRQVLPPSSRRAPWVWAALLGALFAYPPAELRAEDALPPPVIRAPQRAPPPRWSPPVRDVPPRAVPPPPSPERPAEPKPTAVPEPVPQSPVAPEPAAKPEPKHEPAPQAEPVSEAGAETEPGRIVYDERGPWPAPSSSSADPQWASSIMGPRRWAPAPRPRWSHPLEQPVPAVPAVVDPRAAPQPPVAAPQLTPRAAATPAQPLRRPSDLPDWSAAADPAALEARRRDDAKLIHPLDTMPPAADPYWVSTITAPVPTTRVEVGPIRRTPGYGIVPARPRSGPVEDNRVPPPAYETGGRDGVGPRVPPIPPPPRIP